MDFWKRLDKSNDMALAASRNRLICLMYIRTSDDSLVAFFLSAGVGLVGLLFLGLGTVRCSRLRRRPLLGPL